MGEYIDLGAQDGAKVSGYLAKPEGNIKGALVVVQEIFGVNNHIRNVADRFAAKGYVALAPALFDRVVSNVQLEYNEAGIGRGLELVPLSGGTALTDIGLAVKALAEYDSIGIVGYCWGGTLSWRAACSMPELKAAVCYYGGGIGEFADETPNCPVMMHFGGQDDHIPAEEIQKVKAANPEGVEVFVYPDTGHGFNCDERPSYHSESASLAMSRTLKFLDENLA